MQSRQIFVYGLTFENTLFDFYNVILLSYTVGFPGGTLAPYDIRQEGSEMLIECFDGFELHWGPIICHNGSWNSTLPDYCEDIDACVHYNCTYNNETVAANCTDIFGGPDSIQGRLCDCPTGYDYSEESGCVDIDACEVFIRKAS